MFKKQKTKFNIKVLTIIVLFIIEIFSYSLYLQIKSPEGSAAKTFSVPCNINTYGEVWNGILTFGLFNITGTQQSYISYLVVMGTNGELQYLRSSSGMSYWTVKYISQDTLMYQGEPGFGAGPYIGGGSVHFWNFKSNETTDFPNVLGHHDVEYNPVTNTFLTLENYVREINGHDVLFDKIVELNVTGGVLWTWDTYDYLNISEAGPFNETAVYNDETVKDFTHSNAIQWDYTESIVYLNIRHLNTFYKINKTTGKLIWSCGEHGNFTLLDANGRKVPALWFGSHALREVQPDVFIMFDNDFDNETNPNNAQSRMLEVSLNEQTMTARVSWSWTAPKGYWSPYWGKADRLPNGDRMGVFGPPTKQYDNSIGAVIVEVNMKGQVVRTYTFPPGWGIYRIEEISSIVIQKNYNIWLNYAIIVLPILAVGVGVSIYLLKKRRYKNKRPR